MARLDADGSHEALEPLLVEAIAQEEDSYRQALQWWRLAQCRRSLGKDEAAVEALEQVVALDPSCQPAGAAIEQALLGQEDSTRIRAHWAAQLEAVEEPEQRVFLLYRIGERAESSNDQKAAREAMEAVSYTHLRAHET